MAQVLVLLTLPSHFFRKAYFEVLDSAGGELQYRFQQKRGMPVAAALEKMLLDATQASDDPQALPSDLEMYSKDIDKYRLTAQKKMLPDLIQTYNEKIHLQQSKQLVTIILCVKSSVMCQVTKACLEKYFTYFEFY